MGRKTNLEQKLRKTPLAQGNLLHHYQNWRTWDSQIIDTWERYSNVYRRNCEGLHSIVRYWYGERPWHRRWKPPWGFLDDFGSLQEQKSRIYLERIQHFSDVDQRTFRRNSECEMFWFLITIMDEINQWWSSNPMGEGKKLVSTLIPFFLLVGWHKVQERQKDAKAQWKISGCIHHIKMLRESMEKKLKFERKNFFGFSTLSIFRNPERFGGEDPTRELRVPNHLHVNVQQHWLVKKRGELHH